ncbi:hypothetical protein AB0M43_15050 [Longispora sp. NPDC051575]|uniref:hypothetical protein n=1 Tax=Longispora sp. NPDC051575 TaxID=3154943 RepID=UPI00342DF8A3
MRRLLTPRWLLVHLLAVAAVAAMLALGWWQLGRARDGNALSIGYSLEWPVFAAFVVFVWVKSVRRELREGAVSGAASGPGSADPASGSGLAGQTTGLDPASSPAGDPSAPAAPPEPTGADLIRRLAEQRAAARASARADDPETAAYNHYLGWLKSHPHRPPSDYPGVPT